MKRGVAVMMLGLFCFTIHLKSEAQSFELEQLILDVEKLAQLKNIYSDLVKGYEILSDGYNAVSDISKGNFDLHQLFLDGLLKASPAVQQYQKVAMIIESELQIVKEYEAAFGRFKQDDNFSADEMMYIANVYNSLIEESIRGLGDLTTVLTDNSMRASDDERLDLIDRLDADMQDRLSFLRHFNNSTSVLGLQRAKERNDISTIQNIYGLK